MSRVDRLRRADETVLFRNKPGPTVVGAPLAAICGIAVAVIIYRVLAGEVALEDWITPLITLPVLATLFAAIDHRADIMVTDSRLLRSTGLMRRKVEAIALEEIVEVRIRGWETGVLARAPGLMRVTETTGMAIAREGVWFPVDGVGWLRNGKDGSTEQEAFAAAIGLKPRRWRSPSLPEKASLLRAIDFLLGLGAVALWALSCLAVLYLGFGGEDSILAIGDPYFWLHIPGFVAALWLIDMARRYLMLLLAPRLASAAMAQLWLCDALRPDWRGEHPEAVSASRAARIARSERILSKRFGQPVRCADAPGPEAYNGGWFQETSPGIFVAA